LGTRRKTALPQRHGEHRERKKRKRKSKKKRRTKEEEDYHRLQGFRDYTDSGARSSRFPPLPHSADVLLLLSV